MNTNSVMTLTNIHMRFPFGEDWRGRPRGFVHALNGIDLDIPRGKTLGIVGESGCGKSTLAQVLMGIRKPSEGEVTRYFGADHDVQIVFQDPQSSLNARMPVWRVITEPVFAVSKTPKAELRALAAELAAKVGLRPEVLDRYPHEFSGGQRQRIAIARALSSDPDVIVLDEPTSALDISIQAQILNLLKELQAARDLTYIFISHDISVVRYLCDEVAVMYLGQVVEHGASEVVLAAPRHPYTRLLLDSIPTMRATGGLGEALSNTDLPSNRNLPAGCFFKDRCELAGVGCDVRQNMVPTEQAQVRCCQTTAAIPQKVPA
ncbi:oligopeptide/dipeptide ABC transporter ATP-binding protein [Shimia sp.]|jgi:peptide/nickel transport system ATP-binding protein|uniref:oligopeptide/dipeptide ABC transporter ATP-binding protein n=1 Tax=unclassified Shimia TaxID=2630038 RepID=UPI0025CEA46E|nr:oligopeptide/dipeptide ABC transporter ATP-binding protein [Shimia sp.]MCH2068133.1 ATP-binding cassette domain-containing protein [Shimia sp.]